MVSAIALMLFAPVGIESLLPEMTDLDLLTRPRPYTVAQASSYDRNSKSPTQDWFANGDAGKFVRLEGREHVMADLKGPGAVVRVWSANPAGTIRFYFDGEQRPRLEAKMGDLLTGKVQPFGDPYAYTSAQGTNLYFPFPYSKSLKITAEGEGVQALYYHVNFRTYPAGTPIETFSTEALTKAQPLIRQTASRLLANAASSVAGDKEWGRAQTVKPGQTLTTTALRGPGTVRRLEVKIPFPLVQTLREMDWSDPHQPHNVLRGLWLTMNVDGQQTVKAPLGDFFSSTLGDEAQSMLTSVKNGVLVSRFPMPFQRSLTLSVQNQAGVDVPLTVTAHVDRRTAPGPYAFHAQFGRERGRTRPFRDLTFLNTSTEGNFVGSNLHIENPTGAWWGEGDEKVYVDGETFPSTFGTGTEDYYGYAWCSPQLFARPYHGQPRCDGPGNYGHSDVFRWHVFDPIPFRKSLKFDIEMWHWAEVEASWNWTAYWYAKPAPNTAASKPSIAQLRPLELKPKAPVKGATEGESLTVVQKTGGETSNQEGFWELSGGKQLWWVDPKVGDKLVLRGSVPTAGRYKIVGHFCHANDYGIHQLSLNGKPLGKPMDFLGQGVTWKLIDLGEVDLPKGEYSFEVVCVGANPAAAQRRMFGLDYLMLTPVK